MEAKIHHRLGKTFPPIATFIGYAFIGVGLFTAFKSAEPVIGVGLILFGLYIGFSTTGTIIDLNAKRFKVYSSIFGIRIGEWSPLKKYPFVTMILNKKKSRRKKVPIYNVCLIDRMHKKAIVLESGQDKEKLKEDLVEIAQKLNVELVTYDPKKTIHQKRRR